VIAAARDGRRAVLLELDACYADVIACRWQGVTGEAAVLDGDDCTFRAAAKAHELPAAR
jgi:hypothetical protein